MNEARWQRVTDIVNDCLDLPEAERVEFARKQCGDDTALFGEVQQWLDGARDTTGFLARPAKFDAIATEALSDAGLAQHIDAALRNDSSWINRRLGAYRITEEIARGGMGSVFKAVRADDEYEKLVAIKLIRSDVASEVVAQRFRAERQILANLDHPNIARLIDGGRSDDGTPYLVMEFVDGLPIDQYCKQHVLRIPERLKLFRDVCAAVHFAHQRLVVHRDLKPSNILVDGQAQVKLLDFGIAKLLDPTQIDESGKSIANPTVANAMTPAYASPEQVKGEAITTASDVYALGVLLYRLLAGKSPYKSDTTKPLELAKEIVDTEPDRPSSAVTRDDSPRPTERSLDNSKIARTLDSKRLQRSLRGDLDNIVLMALRKDPRRRYVSVEQLSEDVRRSENRQPVLAHADSMAYRARRFVQRNVWSVALSCVAAMGLVTLTATALHQASVARIEKLRAERHFASVRKLADVALFDVHRLIKNLPGSSRVQSGLIKTAVDYLEDLAKDVGDDAVLLSELGAGYVRLSGIQGSAVADANLGETAAARASLERGTAYLADAHSREPHDESIATKYVIALRKTAEFEWSNSQFDAAASAIDRAIAIGKSLQQNTRASIGTKLELAGALLTKARTSPAKRVSREVRLETANSALSILETLRAESLAPADRDRVLQNLGIAYDALAEIVSDATQPSTLIQAYELSLKSLAISESRAAISPTDRERAFNLAATYHSVAANAKELSRTAEAITFRQKAVDVYEQLSRDDPADQNAKMLHIYALTMLGEAQASGEQMEPAQKTIVKALELRKAVPAANLDMVFHRAAAFMLPVVQSAIHVARAKHQGASRAEQVSACQRASASFREVRRAQVAVNDLFLDQSQDPAAELKKLLQFCVSRVDIPS